MHIFKSSWWYFAISYICSFLYIVDIFPTNCKKIKILQSKYFLWQTIHFLILYLITFLSANFSLLISWPNFPNPHYIAFLFNSPNLLEKCLGETVIPLMVEYTIHFVSRTSHSTYLVVSHIRLSMEKGKKAEHYAATKRKFIKWKTSLMSLNFSSDVCIFISLIYFKWD